MKEKIEFNGETFKFKNWRTKPNTALPAVYKDGVHYLDPEVIYESDDGLEIGIHPENPLIK